MVKTVQFFLLCAAGDQTSALQSNSEMTEIVEGSTRLIVPARSLTEQVPPKVPVFFNPAARQSRNLSIVAYNAFSGDLQKLKVRNFADAFAGVGSRALRAAVEVKPLDQVYINDINPIAIETAKQAAQLNSVSDKCVFSENEVCRFLLGGSRPKGSADDEWERFAIVDLDPFGTPARHIDCVLRSVIDGGMISITATDTAVLCGIYPEVCMRRYYGKPLNCEYGNEIALRLLISLIAMTASRLELSIEPLFSHSDMHYLRVYVKVSVSSSEANNVFQNIGYVKHCFGCGNRVQAGEPCTSSCELCGGRMAIGGQLWTGEISSKDFVSSMSDQATDRYCRRIITAAAQDLSKIPYYFTVDEVAKMLKRNPHSVLQTVEVLRAAGFQASVTPLNSGGFKTNAGLEEILRLLR